MKKWNKSFSVVCVAVLSIKQVHFYWTKNLHFPRTYISTVLNTKQLSWWRYKNNDVEHGGGDGEAFSPTSWSRCPCSTPWTTSGTCTDRSCGSGRVCWSRPGICVSLDPTFVVRSTWYLRNPFWDDGEKNRTCFERTKAGKGLSHMIQNATRVNVQRIIVKSAQEKMPQFHRHWNVLT